MRIQVGDVRLFFDVEGTKLVAEGPWMRERQTVVLIHPGPGFDHGLFKVQLGPWLSAGTQVVYTDLRGGGRSDRSTPEERSVERWAGDVKDLCDAIGGDRPVVLVLAAPVARIVAERSIEQYERLGGAEARAVAERFYDAMDEQGFADFLRVCFPLLSSYALTSDVIARADWNPAVLIEWMAGEAKQLDLRDEVAAISAPALVLAGEDDAWAPLESVREVFDLLPGHKQFRSYTRGRHSVFRDAPEAYEDMRLFLDEIDAGEPPA